MAKRNSKPSLTPKHIEAIWRRSEAGSKLKLADALMVFDWTYRTLTPKGRQKLYFDLELIRK